MKVNVPEKLYFGESDKGILDIYSNRESNDEVEYIRKDVFIKKALKFIKINVDRIVNNQHGVRMGCMDREFRKYMEGE